MKNLNITFLIISLFAFIFFDCSDGLGVSESYQNLSLEKAKGGKPGKPDKPGSDDSDPVDIYKVSFAGDVSYAGEDYSDYSYGTTTTISNSPDIFLYLNKSTNKFAEFYSVTCPDLGATTSSVSGLENILPNLEGESCQTSPVCVSFNIRQYDKRKDRQKVFTHLLTNDGRITFRGYIQDQVAGSEDVVPGPGDSVVLVLDRVNINLASPTDPCQLGNTFLNANGEHYESGVAALTIPDQALTITNLSMNSDDVCDLAHNLIQCPD